MCDEVIVNFQQEKLPSVFEVCVDFSGLGKEGRSPSASQKDSIVFFMIPGSCVFLYDTLPGLKAKNYR